MFAIPFSFASVGFWAGLIEFCVIAGVVLALHLIYADVVLKTSASHRLPGYVGAYLGGPARLIATCSALVGICGTLLAYLVLGSVFLQGIVGFGSNFLWVVVLVIIGGVSTAVGLKSEAKINSILTVLLTGCILVLAGILLPRVHTQNLHGFYPGAIFVPYGVFLFALSGGIVVPDMIALLGRKRRVVRTAITVGTLMPALLYAVFAFVVVGAAGVAVSPETISGLRGIVGPGTLLLLQVIGFLAVFTSLLSLSESLQELFRLDFGISSGFAWALTWGTPVLLYLLGFQDFLSIISIVGAVGLGIDSLLILAIYSKLHRRFSLWIWGLYGIMIIGVLYELLRFFAYAPAS